MDFIQLKNKNILITGVANHRSLAWGIAEVLNQFGANLYFSYRKQRSKEKLEELIQEKMPHQLRLYKCDMNNEESLHTLYNDLKESDVTIHGIVHSIAFAHEEDLKGDFVNTSRDGFLFAHETSSFSLIALVQTLKPLMLEGGSVVTLTYLGGERVVPNYKIMGVAKASLEASVKYLANDLGKDKIRVNAISAGPIRTLAAKGVGNFNTILKVVEEKSPLGENVTQEDVGKTALYLLSQLSSGVTAENIHVDSGFHVIS